MKRAASSALSHIGRGSALYRIKERHSVRHGTNRWRYALSLKVTKTTTTTKFDVTFCLPSYPYRISQRIGSSLLFQSISSSILSGKKAAVFLTAQVIHQPINLSSNLLLSNIITPSNVIKIDQKLKSTIRLQNEILQKNTSVVRSTGPVFIICRAPVRFAAVLQAILKLLSRCHRNCIVYSVVTDIWETAAVTVYGARF